MIWAFLYQSFSRFSICCSLVATCFTFFFRRCWPYLTILVSVSTFFFQPPRLSWSFNSGHSVYRGLLDFRGIVLRYYADFDRDSTQLSANDRRVLYNSSKGQPFRRSDTQNQSFHQGRVVDGDETPKSSTSLPLRLQCFGKTASAPVTVTSYKNRFASFLDAERLSSMHQNGDRLKFTTTQICVKHDIAL